MQLGSAAAAATAGGGQEEREGDWEMAEGIEEEAEVSSRVGGSRLDWEQVLPFSSHPPTLGWLEHEGRLSHAAACQAACLASKCCNAWPAKPFASCAAGPLG